MKRFRRHLNPATVMAVLALFVALGGSSFAAPARDAAKHLISGKSIKNNSISSTDIKNNSVGSKDIKNGSLLNKDFKAGQLPVGARGPAGATGSVGRLTYVVRGGAVDGDAGGSDFVDAPCGLGRYATGGSAYASGDPSVKVDFSAPDTGSGGGWTGHATAIAGDDGLLTVYAVCAALPQPALDGAAPY